MHATTIDRTTEPAAYAAAYQGRPGAFSEAAARTLVGRDQPLLPCTTLEDTFAALVAGRTDAAVVPVENSLAGTVPRCYDLMADTRVAVVGEHVLRVDHMLVGRRGASLSGVRRVLSHPVALAQCGRFFRDHPDFEAVPVFDTAGAVPLALESPSGDTAAIAGAEAARLHGAAILAERIQDHADNFTRFLIVRLDALPPPAAGPAKTILAFGLPNDPGALWRALAPFAGAGINMTKIESRPVPERPFEYSFVLECEHPADLPDAEVAFASLSRRAAWARRLGTFPTSASADRAGPI